MIWFALVTFLALDVIVAFAFARLSVAKVIYCSSAVAIASCKQSEENSFSRFKLDRYRIKIDK